MTPNAPINIIVGLSGGVDSSVAALLLKEQGHNVQALFMKNWEEDDTENYCSASQDITDAQTVCDQLQIPLHVVNFAKEYWERVFTHFLQEHRAGRTPNPDILCNKEIKFKAFLDYALQLGATHIATGHYAKIKQQNNQYHLLKSHDLNKDQSYFLYTLGQHELSHALFPVGELLKTDVRKLAKQAKFPNYNKKDSTGICFIGERKFKQFLSQYLPAKPGIIETPTGEAIGKHDGLMYYTIGQRQGLGIGGRRASTNDAWYVVEKDIKRNVLIAAQGKQNPLLFSSKLIYTQPHWISGSPPPFPLHCTAKTRYRQPDQPCVVTAIQGDHYEVQFTEPQWAITPGQSIVFYQNNACLGGGIISL